MVIVKSRLNNFQIEQLQISQEYTSMRYGKTMRPLKLNERS